MFEDEGSLRRRPRGFRRKQQQKAYAGSSASYYSTPTAFDTTPISATDLPTCYTSSPYAYEYGNATGPPGPPFTDVWYQSNDYVKSPASPQNVPAIIETYGNFQYNPNSYAQQIDNGELKIYIIMTFLGQQC